MTAPINSLSSSYQILTSGLQGYDVDVTAAATNIANADSTDYTPERAQNVSTAPGMRAIVQPTDQPVDTSVQLVNMMTAAQGYEAAAKAFGSIAHTEKQSLDIIG